MTTSLPQWSDHAHSYNLGLGHTRKTGANTQTHIFLQALSTILCAHVPECLSAVIRETVAISYDADMKFINVPQTRTIKEHVLVLLKTNRC